jgi:hypothetical protein
MREADYEAKRARREREREAGESFLKMLRERLQADDPYPEALAALRGEDRESEGGDDAA